MESWKYIKGYEGKYQVSNLGNVKSLNYNNTGKERLLKQKINRYGFHEVKLSKNNKTKDFMVARLVAEAFIPNPYDKPFVMHISSDGTNNSVENLKWSYSSEIKFNTYKKGSRPGTPSGNNISFSDKQYKNISQLIKDYGLEPKAVFKRLRRGWSLEESLNIPLKRKTNILHVKLYNYNGQSMSVKQIAEQNGINVKAIYKRLSRGWSIEEAAEIPLAKKGGK